MFNIRKKFIAQAKEKKGILWHNYSNDLDYQFVLELLSGNANFKEKFPIVSSVLAYTREQSLLGNLMRHTEENEKLDFEDSAKIRYINYNPNSTFSTKSSIHLAHPSLSLSIIGELRDITNDKSYDGFAVYDDNLAHIEGEASLESSKLIQSADREFEAVSNFLWIKIDDNNKPFFVSCTEVSDVVKIIGTTNIVKNLLVNDPDSIRNPKRAHTVIVYDRQAQVGEDFDYEYPLVRTGNEVKISLPFNGSAEFNNPFTPVRVDKNYNFKLQIEHPDFGTKSFSQHKWDEIAWEIKGNKLFWKFPSDWGAVLDKKDFTKGTGFDFYCKMNVIVNLNGVEYPQPIPLVVLSDGNTHEDPSYKKIKPLDIWWGCLAKGTQVLMADGSTQNIQNIEIGNAIINDKNEEVIITDIVTGNEETMVLVETIAGNKILLTGEHPILTRRGMVLSDQLTAADILIMYDGNSEELRHVYPVQYKDTVYSLVLEKESAVIGNGFIVGDFAMQQSIKRKLRDTNIDKQKALTPFQKEFRTLIQLIHKERSAQNGKY